MKTSLASVVLLAMLGLANGSAWAQSCPTATGLDGIGFPDRFATYGPPPVFRLVESSDGRWLRARTTGEGALGIGRTTGVEGASIDLREHFLRFRLRVRGEGRIGGMELRVGSGSEGGDYFAFTLPLFTDPLFDPVQAGPWLDLSLSFASAAKHGAPDRAAIRWVGWVVRDDGTGPIEVDLADIEAVPLPPEGVLSLTFDDGYVEHATVAAKAMRSFGFSGTAYVMPEQVGVEGYVSLEQLEEMARDGWDIASHHAIPVTDWSDAELAPKLAGVRGWLVEHGFARGAGHLAYPLGRHDPGRVVPATRRVFETARVASAGPETLPPADRYRLRALNVLGGTTKPADIGEMARAAVEHRHWAVLMFHHLVPGAATNDLEYGEEDFVRALEEIRDTGIEVSSVSEVAARWRCAPSLPAKSAEAAPTP